jgi:hypothetical protein
MKTSLLLLVLLCLCATETLAQQKMLQPDEYTDHIRTVGGELQITPDNEVEFNGRPLFTFHPYKDEGGRGVFLTPVYSFGRTDLVLFWECGTEIYATGTMRLISVTRTGLVKAWPRNLGTGMFPVITKTRNSLKIFFPPSLGLHGGGAFPETWVWQRGKLIKIKTIRKQT